MKKNNSNSSIDSACGTSSTKSLHKRSPPRGQYLDLEAQRRVAAQRTNTINTNHAMAAVGRTENVLDGDVDALESNASEKGSTGKPLWKSVLFLVVALTLLLGVVVLQTLTLDRVLSLLMKQDPVLSHEVVSLFDVIHAKLGLGGASQHEAFGPQTLAPPSIPTLDYHHHEQQQQEVHMVTAVIAPKSPKTMNNIQAGEELLRRNRDIALEIIKSSGPLHDSILLEECQGFFRTMDFFAQRRFTSKCSQDFWLYNFVFAPLLNKAKIDRTYIDMGTHDYRFESTMYAFDVCLGFHGICGEPEPQHHEGIRQHRRCNLLDTCASDKQEQVDFVFHGDTSGIPGTHAERELPNQSHTKLTCERLQTKLDESRISRVSFMSLDVEGAEIKALNGIDFTRTQVGLLVIEKPKEKDLRKVLNERLMEDGYTELVLPGGVPPLATDLIFIHESFPLQPEDIVPTVTHHCTCQGCFPLESR